MYLLFLISFSKQTFQGDLSLQKDYQHLYSEEAHCPIPFALFVFSLCFLSLKVFVSFSLLVFQELSSNKIQDKALKIFLIQYELKLPALSISSFPLKLFAVHFLAFQEGLYLKPACYHSHSNLMMLKNLVYLLIFSSNLWEIYHSIEVKLINT